MSKEFKELKKLIKDKKFRDELTVALIKELLESNNMNISEKDANKRIKEIFREMIDMEYNEENEEMIDN